jgi:DNA-binding NtrC family response regulator
VLAATNRDLEREVASGRFRADLYYRIHVVPVELPPLRERREDVRLLAEAFLERTRGESRRGPQQLAPDALAALERYAWPGNVRELENAIERAVTLGAGDSIGLADLPGEIQTAGRTEALRDELRAGRIGLEEAVAHFEADLIRDALERTAGNQTRAAEILGITRRLIKLKMDRYGIAATGDDSYGE